jgi:hypothetical protein
MTDIFGFVDAVSYNKPSIRRRMATVISVESDVTMTVSLAGNTDPAYYISQVRYMEQVAPRVGGHVWLDTDGADIVAVGRIVGRGAQYPHCRVYRSADQSIPNGTTYTTVTFTTADVNFYGMWSAGAPTVITVPFAGLYQVSINMAWATNSTGLRTAIGLVNGTTQSLIQIDGLSATGAYLSNTTIVSIPDGGTVSMQVRQTSGAALAALGGSRYETSMSVTYVGPSS